jgi:adenylate cyclase
MPRRPDNSPYDWLVDRWLDLTTWPTAKKTALTMGIALVFHLVVLTVALLAIVTWSPGLMDVGPLSRLAVVVIACNVGILAVSLAVARRGSEGRWTVYLLILVYVPSLVWMLSLFGTMSAPLAVPLLLILLGLVFFDRVVGRIASAYFISILAVTSVLELTGRIPFAPIVKLRTFDAQLTPGWYAAVYITVLSTFAYVYLLVEFSVVVRESQQRRLEQAHRDLSRTSEQLGRASDLIGRYVAAQVTEQIFAGNYGVIDKHDRRKITLVFSDIKGFSAMADRMEPEDVSRLLNEYLSEMTAIAQVHDGTVDKFIGDAVMVLFGAPVATKDRDHALRAVRMATAMQSRVAELSAKWLGEGLLDDEPFQVRIGINSGMASVGNFGSKDRLDYTAIGRQVNLAARLQVSCEPGKVLLSHPTWALIKDEIACVPKGEIEVKGMHHAVKVYEVALKDTQQQRGSA